MELTFAPRDILQINDARIIYRNLRGEGSKFNREGDRNFAVVIPNQELADELIDRGWNVKIKEPRDEGEEPFRYLPVKVKFNDRGPQVYLVSGNAHRELSEDMQKVVAPPQVEMILILKVCAPPQVVKVLTPKVNIQRQAKLELMQREVIRKLWGLTLMLKVVAPPQVEIILMPEV